MNVYIISIDKEDLIHGNDIDLVGDEAYSVIFKGTPNLIIDFERVQRCSSYMLGKIVGIRKRCFNANGRLILCGVGPQLMEGLKVTGLRILFEIVEDLDAAKDAMKESVVSWTPKAEVSGS